MITKGNITSKIYAAKCMTYSLDYTRMPDHVIIHPDLFTELKAEVSNQMGSSFVDQLTKPTVFGMAIIESSSVDKDEIIPFCKPPKLTEEEYKMSMK